ncbi:DUF4199 domain-containing protein [Parafilimonas terrae]|jgi:hypothetical protein|uniref:DUF4199 domain-containing protein n=1 Tax=Parafilimonas terrae TaxID=1465490 RepID=A0A1I5XU05_9BACT|nr:DUF4199 domain-containing protein [Parafilimonas terrae]SFQ35463.1 Protein of unknown function [Parafilimonas terrae]
MENKVTTPQVKGLIISLILIVYGLIIYFVDGMKHPELSYVQYALFLAGIIWACVTYSNQLNANVTFGNLFAHGFKTTAVITVIVLLYTILAFKVLFPEMIDKSIEMTRQKMEADGKASDSQIDQAISMMREHYVLFAVVGVIVGFAIIGAISSLIGAAIAKKKPQDPFGNQPI